MNVEQCARDARAASLKLASASREARDAALSAIKTALKARSKELFAANAADLERSAAEGLAAPLLKRLKFDETKLDEVLAGLDSLSKMKDPLGRILSARELSPGLVLRQVSCPLGVIGMIFESRPDALVQIAGLCLKSGNAVLLKGGREASLTNASLAAVIQEASVGAGMPSGWLANLESREDVNAMLGLSEYIDLLIPRGSNQFVKYIMDHSDIPVMGHADGICHVYLHEDADQEMAVRVCVDSKTQYVAVCNAAETLLVHSAAAGRILPALAHALAEKKVEIRGCERTRRIIDCVPATEVDWRTEYLDYTLSIKVVDSLDQAIAHINEYGSGHTDAIVTASLEAAERFMNEVDSADVFWNASTRFSDGFKFGLGAEVGISTSKLHARGPVGLEGLCSYKWKIYGSGQIVADFAEGRAAFTHRELEDEPEVFSPGRAAR